jgi:hypothetical protein
MGLFVALLATWLRSAWRLCGSDVAPEGARQLGLLLMALLGVYLPNAMSHDVSIIPMANMILFFFGGAVTGMASPLFPRASAPRRTLSISPLELVGALD